MFSWQRILPYWKSWEAWSALDEVLYCLKRIRNIKSFGNLRFYISCTKIAKHIFCILFGTTSITKNLAAFGFLHKHLTEFYFFFFSLFHNRKFLFRLRLLICICFLVLFSLFFIPCFPFISLFFCPAYVLFCFFFVQTFKIKFFKFDLKLFLLDFCQPLFKLLNDLFFCFLALGKFLGFL